MLPSKIYFPVTFSRDVPFAGAFAIAKRQSECGSKTVKCTSANNGHNVCWAVFLFIN